MSHTRKDIGWRFPLNDGGLEDGFNDSGIETYRGRIYENLARETIQNSLDAANSESDQPVRVAFQYFEISSEKFPGRQALLRALQSTRDRHGRGSHKADRFFKAAIELLRQDKVPFLRVSDFNTTGLTGAKIDNPHDSNWASLVKAIGVSSKPDGSGGSFGIGKHAPYACSALRSVFYGTYDRDGVAAFQGVAKLASHVDDQGRLTRGTGFYGRLGDYGPILHPAHVDPIFTRGEVGTDIFVAGFKAVEGWEAEIVRSVLDNFFVAIHQERLVVDVQGLIIDRNSLPGLLRQYIVDQDSLTLGYYRALTTSDAKFHEIDDFEGLGRVRLFLHEDRHYTRKSIAMVRATGMTVFPKNTHARVPVRFVGVLIADGEGINKLLRSMEPPAHDKWDPNLIEDEDERRFARRVRTKLYNWINEMIKELAPAGDVEQIAIEGLGGLLVGESLPVGEAAANPASPGQTVKAGPVEITELGPTRVRSRHQAEQEPHEKDEGEVDVPDEPKDGNDGEPKRPKPPKPPKPPAPRGQTVPLHNKRIFCTDADRGHYVVKFTPEADGPAMMSVFVQGEDDAHPARLAYAKDEASGRELHVVDGQRNTVGPISLNSKQRNSILLVLEEPLRVALEVVVRAS